LSCRSSVSLSLWFGRFLPRLVRCSFLHSSVSWFGPRANQHSSVLALGGRLAEPQSSAPCRLGCSPSLLRVLTSSRAEHLSARPSLCSRFVLADSPLQKAQTVRAFSFDRKQKLFFSAGDFACGQSRLLPRQPGTATTDSPTLDCRQSAIVLRLLF